MTDDTAHAGPASGPAPSVGFLLSQLGFATSRRFTELLLPLELDPRQFALMRYVQAAEGHSQHDLGEALDVPASRMVALLDDLEERGLVERRANPNDRRAKALYLTPEGRKLLDRAGEVASELERAVCAGLGQAERDELVRLLQRLGANLGVTFGVHPALKGSGLAHED